jgi:hypothetical protein
VGPENTIKAIIARLEKSVIDLQLAIPEVEQGMLNKLSNIIKEFNLKDGKLLNNVDNLRKLQGLQNSIQSLIITGQYRDKVKEFVSTYSEVEQLNKDYFKEFNLKFTPKETLKIIRKSAVDRTVNGLIGQGLAVNISDRIHQMLIDNITSGGSYSSLTEQLNSQLKSSEVKDSILKRYTRTIATDSINQFNAQYHEAIAQDLNLNWGRYVGSNLTTTREFCERLSAKQWVHRSELPEVIKGRIDGQQVDLSKSTGLPAGMIPGTDVDNFKVRRGGYNCGHQFFWVPDAAVPPAIKAKVFPEPEKKKPVKKAPASKSKKMEETGETKPAGKKVSSQLTTIEKKIADIIKNAMNAIDSVHGDGVLDNIPLKAMGRSAANGSFYHGLGKAVKIEIKKSAPSPELTFAHEMGHYLDFQALGAKGSFETEVSNSSAKALINKLNETARIKEIQKTLKDGILVKDGKQYPISAAIKKHLLYMLEPKEMFARSYAQFIAVKSGNKKMMKQLAARQLLDKGMNIGYQWEDEDFKEIIAAFEELFLKQGWLSR